MLEQDTDTVGGEEEDLGGPVFHPPLYRQRYSTVISLLQQHHVSKVNYK